MLDSNGFENYHELNAALNSVIFDGRYANRPLYLDIEGDLLKEISTSLDIKSEEVPGAIANAVKNSFDFTVSNPFKYHENWHRCWWNSDRSNPPPSTALVKPPCYGPFACRVSGTGGLMLRA